MAKEQKSRNRRIYSEKKIRKVLVVGAGTMGHGIAQVFAQNGHRVSLVDNVAGALDRAETLIRSSLSTMVEAGLVKEEDIAPVLERIAFATNLEEAARDADLAIECIIEDRDAKKSVFQKLDAACSSRTILASNSTFLDIFEFVQVSHPERLMMIHWYAPPQIIPLVDVVKGPQTSQENIEAVLCLLRELDKKPILFNKPCAGYVVSRLQVAAQREVYWLLDNGYISPRDLDEATIWGLAFRMVAVGVCQRIDFGGLDLSARTIKEAPQQCTPVDYQPRMLLDLVQQGALGVKAGRGFYDYKGKSEAEVCRDRDIRLLKLLKFLKESDLAGPV